MQKDFDGWNAQKKHTHREEQRPFFHEREIWYCKLGTNIGYEQDGRGKDFLRPIVIIRKFNTAVLFGVPLTRQVKINRYYFVFSFQKEKQSAAILSPLRLVDAKRLSHKIGLMSEADYRLLTKKLKELLP